MARTERPKACHAGSLQLTLFQCLGLCTRIDVKDLRQLTSIGAKLIVLMIGRPSPFKNASGFWGVFVNLLRLCVWWGFPLPFFLVGNDGRTRLSPNQRHLSSIV